MHWQLSEGLKCICCIYITLYDEIFPCYIPAFTVVQIWFLFSFMLKYFCRRWLQAIDNIFHVLVHFGRLSCSVIHVPHGHSNSFLPTFQILHPGIRVSVSPLQEGFWILKQESYTSFQKCGFLKWIRTWPVYVQCSLLPTYKPGTQLSKVSCHSKVSFQGNFLFCLRRDVSGGIDNKRK